MSAHTNRAARRRVVSVVGWPRHTIKLEFRCINDAGRSRGRYVLSERGHPVALMAPPRRNENRSLEGFYFAYRALSVRCRLCAPVHLPRRAIAFWETPVGDCVSMSATLRTEITCVSIFPSPFFLSLSIGATLYLQLHRGRPYL